MQRFCENAAAATWAAGAPLAWGLASLLSRMPTRLAPELELPPPPDASEPSNDDRLALFTICGMAHENPVDIMRFANRTSSVGVRARSIMPLPINGRAAVWRRPRATTERGDVVCRWPQP